MGLFDSLKLDPADKQARENQKFMRLALKEAEKAYAIHEVPIGCIIVKDGKVIAKGSNRRNKDRNVISHAEILAISDACKKIHDWRLEDCTMYVTLEPCPMCAGAIVQARMKKVVIGTENKKGGCAGSVLNILQTPGFPQQVEIEFGILRDECSTLLSKFFQDLREQKDDAESNIGTSESGPYDTISSTPLSSDAVSNSENNNG